MPSFSKKSSNSGNKARPSNFVVFSVATYGTEDHKSGVRALAAILDYEGNSMCDAAIYGGEDAADDLRPLTVLTVRRTEGINRAENPRSRSNKWRSSPNIDPGAGFRMQNGSLWNVIWTNVHIADRS